MITISLNRLTFFAYHGLYPEEKKSGGEFVVDLRISFPEDSDIKKLEDTLDYSELYELIRIRMEKSTELLETLSMELANEIKTSYPKIIEISLTIEKVRPPIPNFSGSVSVTYQKKY